MNLGPTQTAEQEFRKKLLEDITYWENRDDGSEYADILKEVICKVFSKSKTTFTGRPRPIRTTGDQSHTIP